MKYFSKTQLTQHFLSCFFIVFLTVNCTQDPLSNLPTSAKDRLNMLSDTQFKRKNLDSQVREISSNFGRILANDFWQASPEKEFEMILTAKVFLNEDQFDNFNVELEDAVFENEDYSLNPISSGTESNNERKYLFKWNPSENFLSNYFEKCIPITFKLQTSGDLILERTDAFVLFVTNKSRLPVLQIINMPRAVKEDDEGIMTVHVFDPQATTTNPPVVMLNEVKFHEDVLDEERPRDLNQLLHLVGSEKIDENIWKFEYRLISNVLNAGLDRVTYALEMFATSVSGVSDTQKVTLTVFNRVLIPKVIGPSETTLHAGKTSFIFIQVLDPLASGNLSSRLLTAEEDLPGEVIFNYDITPEGMLVFLSLSAPEDVDTSQKYKASIEIMNEGIENSQTISESVVHDISIGVASLENETSR